MPNDAGMIRSLASVCPDCGKVRYLSRADAKRAARAKSQRARAYRCGQFWHLTHFGPASKVAYYREQAASREAGRIGLVHGE